jgi:hypothetical protein
MLFIIYKSFIQKDNYYVAFVTSIRNANADDPNKYYSVMQKSQNVTISINEKMIVFKSSYRFLPNKLFRYLNYSCSDVLQKSFTFDEIENIINVAKEKAARSIQKKVIVYLYTPPTGKMYKRLCSKFNNYTSYTPFQN